MVAARTQLPFDTAGLVEDEVKRKSLGPADSRASEMGVVRQADGLEDRLAHRSTSNVNAQPLRERQREGLSIQKPLG